MSHLNRDSFGGRPRGECDRCGFEVPHDELRPEWRFDGGDKKVRTGLIICRNCVDESFPQNLKHPFRDPRALHNPRPPRVSYLYVLPGGTGNGFLFNAAHNAHFLWW